MCDKKYHYFYKITNCINGKFYYGIHSTNNLNDGYMGSGKRLKYAVKKYGIENFNKDIIKFFNSRKELSDYEKTFINDDLVFSNECYNLINGGEYFNTNNKVIVKNLITGKNEIITQEQFNNDKNIKYSHNSYGFVTVTNGDGKYFNVSIEDERYLSGKLHTIWKGKTHKKSSIIKQKNTFRKNNHQQKEHNSQYNTCWIHNTIKSIKINKDDLNKYLSDGWIKGRKMFNSSKTQFQSTLGHHWFHKYENGILVTKCISNDEIEDYLNKGWIKGRK